MAELSELSEPPSPQNEAESSRMDSYARLDFQPTDIQSSKDYFLTQILSQPNSPKSERKIEKEEMIKPAPWMKPLDENDLGMRQVKDWENPRMVGEADLPGGGRVLLSLEYLRFGRIHRRNPTEIALRLSLQPSISNSIIATDFACFIQPIGWHYVNATERYIRPKVELIVSQPGGILSGSGGNDASGGFNDVKSQEGNDPEEGSDCSSDSDSDSESSSTVLSNLFSSHQLSPTPSQLEQAYEDPNTHLLRYSSSKDGFRFRTVPCFVDDALGGFANQGLNFGKDGTDEDGEDKEPDEHDGREQEDQMPQQIPIYMRLKHTSTFLLRFRIRVTCAYITQPSAVGLTKEDFIGPTDTNQSQGPKRHPEHLCRVVESPDYDDGKEDEPYMIGPISKSFYFNMFCDKDSRHPGLNHWLTAEKDVTDELKLLGIKVIGDWPSEEQIKQAKLRDERSKNRKKGDEEELSKGKGKAKDQDHGQGEGIKDKGKEKTIDKTKPKKKPSSSSRYPQHIGLMVPHLDPSITNKNKIPPPNKPNGQPYREEDPVPHWHKESQTKASGDGRESEDKDVSETSKMEVDEEFS